MNKSRLSWIILLSLALLLKVFSLFPDAVEKYYSQGIYAVLSRLLRRLFGWLPFSFGDIIYAVAIILIVRGVFRVSRKIFRKETDKVYWKKTGQQVLFYSIVVYTVFNILWGLNYNRKGIAWELSLETVPIQTADLVTVMQALAAKVNQLDSVAHENRQAIGEKKYLFSNASAAYKELSEMDNRFLYSSVSLKPSLFSYLGNYLGYTGYYNPFSAEAQVNTTVPLFIQPFTACHEIGHQLGYAKENEANFAGFLAARLSPDPVFRYSVYFEMYSYGRPYLYFRDSVLLKKLDSSLNKGVKDDFHELRKFSKQHENPLEYLIDKLYGQYLKANEQPDGKVTYSKVMVWLLAYYRKKGEI